MKINILYHIKKDRFVVW